MPIQPPPTRWRPAHNHSGRRWLPTLTQPTLVLAGDDDPIVPLVNGRILAPRIPRARLQVIQDGGHRFILERPAEMAELVARFLHSGGHQ